MGFGDVDPGFVSFNGEEEVSLEMAGTLKEQPLLMVAGSLIGMDVPGQG